MYHTLNPQENTLIIVTMRRVSVNWAQIDEIHNWDWQLYVLHWHREKELLFIHNSSNAGSFKDLAKSVAGEDVEQIRGPKSSTVSPASIVSSYRMQGCLRHSADLSATPCA